MTIPVLEPVIKINANNTIALNENLILFAFHFCSPIHMINIKHILHARRLAWISKPKALPSADKYSLPFTALMVGKNISGETMLNIPPIIEMRILRPKTILIVLRLFTKQNTIEETNTELKKKRSKIFVISILREYGRVNKGQINNKIIQLRKCLLR